MKPLLLLDVDGVLNAVRQGADPDTWPTWSSGTATAEGRTYPIRWAPAVVERLLGLDVELQWLTTWEHDANRSLRDLLGTPSLPVAGTRDEGSASSLAGDSLAGSTAAAPDELTGEWWKLDVVRDLRAAWPDRLLVWVDDELRGDTNHVAQWAESVDVVAVGPEPSTGLSPADLDRIDAALR